MPLIPYTFEEPEEGYESLIQHQKKGDCIKIAWSGVESTMYHKGEIKWYPDLENISENTKDFTFYPNYGFSIGRYSEFLIAPDYGDRVKEITIKIDSNEVSIGQVTPLALYLLDGMHEKHIDPYWGDMLSFQMIAKQPFSNFIESLSFIVFFKIKILFLN